MNVTIAATTVAVALAAGGGGGVVGSKHDLSMTGPGPLRATTRVDPCAFCHMPHGGGKQLSSRPDPQGQYRPYESGTMRARPATPEGSSRLCLSCHDGTIAVGQTRSRRIEMSGAAGDGRIPAGRRSNLGTDLRKSHPISISAADGAHVQAPRGGHGAVRLAAGGNVECTSCHDPHAEFRGAPEGKFLRETSSGGTLCLSCHQIQGGSHSTAARPASAVGSAVLGTGSVAAAGCLACHRSHGASTKGANLALEETDRPESLCLRCHSGASATVDIARDLAKPSSHVVGEDRHDAAEGPDSATRRLPETSPGAPRHATCVDCHDPHAAVQPQAGGAGLGGTLTGMWGIDAAGRRVDPAQYEYEICFKCHGDSANQPAATTPSGARRAGATVNLRRAFSPTARSSHPVEASGRNPDVPSLRAPLGTSSTIKCTDCHASDSGPAAGGTGARGPHGSTFAHLLERNYATGDRTTESPAAYALCYKCHSRDVLLSDDSAFRPHRVHVVNQGASCSVCHAAHGVVDSPSGGAHLVDFDLSIVSPLDGRLEYSSFGGRSGSCNLRCHGASHTSKTY